MPPGRPKGSRNKPKDPYEEQKNVIALLKAAGQDTSELERALVSESPEKTRKETAVDIVLETYRWEESQREAESVMALAAVQEKFCMKVCKWCERPFVTNYACVAYDKEECRALALAELGIKWEPNKPPEQRWS